MEVFKIKAIVTVIGQDKVGIIYGITKILSEYMVNIEDISQTILQEYFTMMMLVDLSNKTIDFEELKVKLEGFSNEIGVSIRIQREELFKTMHSI